MVRVYPITPQSQFKNNSRATVPLRIGLRDKISYRFNIKIDKKRSKKKQLSRYIS